MTPWQTYLCCRETALQGTVSHHKVIFSASRHTHVNPMLNERIIGLYLAKGHQKGLPNLSTERVSVQLSQCSNALSRQHASRLSLILRPAISAGFIHAIPS